MIIELSELHETEEAEYGKCIYRLSTAQNIGCRVITTVILPASHFQNYISNRSLKDELIEILLMKLSVCGVLPGNDLLISCSFYKENLVPLRSIKAANTYTSVKFAVNKLYDAWFDEKALSYRITHKMVPEHTYPTIFIQPYVQNVFSIVTRNPVSGETTNASNYAGIIHNKVDTWNSLYEHLISQIDTCFARPLKIVFIQEDRQISILQTDEYPMTNRALFFSLIEKYNSSLISGKELLEQISPEEICTYLGYTLVSENKYNADLPLSPGAVAGRVIFTTTRQETLSAQVSIFYSHKKHL